MINFSNELIKHYPDLNNDEMNLISVAFKNLIGASRTSGRFWLQLRQRMK